MFRHEKYCVYVNNQQQNLSFGHIKGNKVICPAQ